MSLQFENKSTLELVRLYSQVLTELKERKIIRTNNFIGEIGEHLAVDMYNNSECLPNLKLVPAGTKSIDAISIDSGKRYAIKSVSTKLTSVFYGLEPLGSLKPNDLIFDYVIIVIFTNNFNLSKIIEMTWHQFLEHKKWHSTMRAWNISVNKKLLEDSKTIYSLKE